MLGTHAILYISRKYKEAIILAMDECIKSANRYVNDMAIANIQNSFIVYANKMPTFYQSNKFNDPTIFNVERATKIQILDDMSIKEI
jgi:hypothetical protein